MLALYDAANVETSQVAETTKYMIAKALVHTVNHEKVLRRKLD